MIFSANKGNLKWLDRSIIHCNTNHFLPRALLHILHLILSGDRIRRDNNRRFRVSRRQSLKLGYWCLLESVLICIHVLNAWSVHDTAVVLDSVKRNIAILTLLHSRFERICSGRIWMTIFFVLLHLFVGVWGA